MSETPSDDIALARRETVLLGLIGAAIGASRMPAVHQGEAAAQGLTAIYRLIDLDTLGLTAADLPALLSAAQRFGFAGLNITFPCKQAVLAHLDALSPDAQVLGAVNTVVLRDGRRVGHNTDWWGYAESFRRSMMLADLRRVVLFGAGGGGLAVGYALLTLGAAKLTIIDADRARASQAAEHLGSRFPDRRVETATAAEAAVRAATGIVNATPMGMAKFPGTPFPTEWLDPAQWVSDIVYFPLETELLRAARQRGCRTLDGSGMSVFQAAEAFRLFTGRPADLARIRRLFEAAG